MITFGVEGETRFMLYMKITGDFSKYSKRSHFEQDIKKIAEKLEINYMELRNLLYQSGAKSLSRKSAVTAVWDTRIEAEKAIKDIIEQFALVLRMREAQ